MAYMMLKHSVKDYGAWKTVFDGDTERRRSGGSKSSQLFRDTQHPDSISVLLEFDSIDKAQKFGRDPGMKETMERAGVIGKPDISYLDFVQRKDN